MNILPVQKVRDKNCLDSTCAERVETETSFNTSVPKKTTVKPHFFKP